MMDPILIIVVLEIAITLVALIFAPKVFLKNAKNLTDLNLIDKRIEIRKLVISAMSALLVVSAAVGAWREYRFEEYKDFGRQIVAAMNLLDSKSPAVQIGGVYALGRVIEDSSRDAEPMLRALVSALHQWTNKKVRARDAPLGGAALAAFRVFGDLQVMALKRCGGLEFEELNLRSFRGENGNYSSCTFVNVDLTGASMPGVNLSESTLVVVNFNESDLRNALFDRSNLTGVSFVEADLRGASFEAATGLEVANFLSANVEGTKFSPEFKKKLMEQEGYR